MQETMNKNRKKKHYLGFKILWIIVPILILYIVLSFYYNTHFYTNTNINGVKVSNMTVSQVESAINEEIKSYSLTLNGRNGVTTKIYGNYFDLLTTFDGSLNDLIKDQNSFVWPVNLFKTKNLNISTMLEFDETMLKNQIDKLVFFQEDNVIEPTDAYISEYGEEGFSIIPENHGTKLNKDKLYEAVKSAVTSLEPELSLEDTDSYENAKVTSSNPELLASMEEMNRIVGAKITYEFGEDVEILDGNQINEWLSVDKNNKIVLSAEKVKEYVDYIGKTYNSFGRTRTLKTSYGDVIEIKGGDYGWWLNRVKEASELTELILDGKQVTKEPAYLQVAQQYGKDDIGDTYVEVNLTAQHLFFYKEGKLIVETDFVSGNLSKDYGTPTGTFPIQYKENDATLKGEDYRTPVDYWMPFNGNIGFHDAPWRNEFGKNIYFTNGSHGCINMPPKAAKLMFENIKRGIAVYVYELPGTEYDNKKDDNKLENNKENKDINKKTPAKTR